MSRRRHRVIDHHINKPSHPHLHSDPTAADRQINPNVRVKRDEDGGFIVFGVLRAGGAWSHFLSAECPHCHTPLKIVATGPSEMPAYAEQEACRLAVMEHLRTDHDQRKKTENG